MKWRNGLAALIGIWFIISPWVFHYSDHTGAVWTSVVLGAIQLIASAWAMFKEDTSGWKVWQTWGSLIMGVWFIIQPFAFSLGTSEVWISVILGAVTIILNLWTMAVNEDSTRTDSSHGRHAHA